MPEPDEAEKARLLRSGALSAITNCLRDARKTLETYIPGNLPDIASRLDLAEDHIKTARRLILTYVPAESEPEIRPCSK